MNGTVPVNVVMVFSGTVVLLALWVLGGSYLSENHGLRQWAVAFMAYHGPIEIARMVGVVLLMFTVVILLLSASQVERTAPKRLTIFSLETAADIHI